MADDRDDVLLKFAKAVRRGLFMMPDEDTLADLDDVVARLESQGEAEDATPPPADEVSDEELYNVVVNGPVWPGDTTSHRTANALVPAGLARRDDRGAFVATQDGVRELVIRQRRAALAARADLAAARRERDEARAEVERLREAARLVVHNAFRIDNNDGYMKIGARWIAALRAALATPTQEPKP